MEKSPIELNRSIYRDFLKADLQTPAYVYDARILLENVQASAAFARETNSTFLYSVKPCAQESILKLLLPHVDGFGVSSLFESRFCREIVGESKHRLNGASPEKIVHITTPCYREDEFQDLLQYVDGITFNSLPQFNRLSRKARAFATCGLRVNPELSFVKEAKYNPCRPNSKLGVPLDQIRAAWEKNPKQFAHLDGLHIHSNSGSRNLMELHRTVEKLCAELSPILEGVEWVNLGGGYFFNQNSEHADAFREAVQFLQDRYSVDVTIEPGESVISSAGYLVSRVVDLFETRGKQVVILDASVNHMPEYFEYNLEPDLLNGVPEGKHEYLLGGATCLAGDIFGQYTLDKKLTVGDLVVFHNVGSYTLTKAHMFNGINLPTVYIRGEDGQFDLEKWFGYEHYTEIWRPGHYADRAGNHSSKAKRSSITSPALT